MTGKIQSSGPTTLNIAVCTHLPNTTRIGNTIRQIKGMFAWFLGAPIMMKGVGGKGVKSAFPESCTKGYVR